MHIDSCVIISLKKEFSSASLTPCEFMHLVRLYATPSRLKLNESESSLNIFCKENLRNQAIFGKFLRWTKLAFHSWLHMMRWHFEPSVKKCVSLH